MKSGKSRFTLAKKNTVVVKMASSPQSRSRMITQSPQAVIMIRPAAFGFNEETMASNSFQKASSSDESAKQIQDACLKEFDAGKLHNSKYSALKVV